MTIMKITPMGMELTKPYQVFEGVYCVLNIKTNVVKYEFILYISEKEQAGILA